MTSNQFLQAPKATADESGIIVGRNVRDETEALTQSTIMMIDDEPTTMDLIQAVLEDAGYERFIPIEESLQALATIKAQRPDVVLLDLMMPEVSGFQILESVRRDPALEQLPIIILTSSGDADTKLRALELGATDFLAKPVDPSELCLRVRNTLSAKAYRDQLAYYDAMTGLPNQRLFVERLSWALRSAESAKRPVAVLHIGLDRLRSINNSLASRPADGVLDEIVRRFQRCVANRPHDRDVRPAQQDHRTLSRLETDEFAVLLSDIADIHEATVFAQRLLSALKEPVNVDGCEVIVSPNVGIAAYPEDGDEAEVLLRRAASAMHFARQRRANTYLFYSREMHRKSFDRLRLESELRRAVENDELVLHFQPKLDARSRRIVGAEALVRWQHPERGLLAPGEFIPLAEETGLIRPLGEWVLRRACHEAMSWQATGPLSVAVNVSAAQFLDPKLAEAVAAALRRSRLDPSLLALELTESVVMHDADGNDGVLKRLKGMGVGLSIDDFGTGYSSLSYLKRFPLDELKIDRSFVNDVHSDPEDRAIVAAIVAMAHALGLRVVGEGVENAEQMECLSSEGCDQYQGFYFSRPVTAAGFREMLRLEQPLPMAIGSVASV